MPQEAKPGLIQALTSSGMAPQDSLIRWARKRTIARTFRLRRWFVLRLLVFVPPLSRPKVQAGLAWLALLAVLLLEFWYVRTEVPGTRFVDVQVRWAAYICDGMLVLLGLVAGSTGEDAAHRSTRFTAGSTTGSLLVGDVIVFGKGVGARPIRVSSIRRVWRLLGIVALELPSRRYALVPAALFFDRETWPKVRRRFGAAREP